MPRRGHGAIIMFHDGGGNRGETLAALPVVITRLKAEGYRFTTVTGAPARPAIIVAMAWSWAAIIARHACGSSSAGNSTLSAGGLAITA